MMTAVFIGDEVTAAAFRLAGATAQAPKMQDVPHVFEKLFDDADLVIITADYARALEKESLRATIRRADPLVLVVPDGGNQRWPEDLDTRVDRVLGIEQ